MYLAKWIIYPNTIARGPQRRGPNAAASVASAQGRPCSHCTQARSTVLVLCTDELAVHSYPLLCLQRKVVKHAIGLFYCTSLLRTMATNLQRFTSSNRKKHFAACDYWKHTSWQVYCSKRLAVNSAKPHAFILCKKHELICSNASILQVWKIHC